MAIRRTKRKTRRRKLPSKKVLGKLRQVNFDPKTGAKLKGFHVMTPSGLVIKVPAHMLK